MHARPKNASTTKAANVSLALLIACAGACHQPQSFGTSVDLGVDAAGAVTSTSNACTGVTCNSPPAPACVGLTTLRSYPGSGVCANGQCSYSPSDTTCLNGCQAGACVELKPCPAGTCTSPPATACVDIVTLRNYLLSGTCANGICNYDWQDTHCPNGCASAACKLKCFDGTSSACASSGMQWNGSQCCTSVAASCVAGNAASCTGSGMQWTGSLCCIDDVQAQCVDGSSDYCAAIGLWTGSLCCTGYTSCANGEADASLTECLNSNGHWTGAVCCF